MTTETVRTTSRSRAWLRFVGTSSVGALFFLLPVRWQGSWTVPFDVVVGAITDSLPGAVRIYSVLVIVASAVLSVAAPLASRRSGRTWEVVAGFATSPVLLAVRVAGAVIALMLLAGVGPSALLDPSVGGLMLDTLVAAVAVIVPIGAVFITLFVAFGALEFVGTLARPMMRPLFRVPGRAALDGIASFVGSYSVGLYVTNKMYLLGRYTSREALVVATCFSTVSLGFFAVVAATLDLLPYFGAILVSTSAVTVLLAVVLCRIPPLSRVADDYRGTADPEHEPEGRLFPLAVRVGLDNAGSARPVWREALTGLVDGVRLVVLVLPAILAIGVGAILLAQNTPVFEWIGSPLEPLIRLLGIPDAEIVAQASVIGVSEMFLPALISVEAAVPAKFFVAVLSLSQIMFFSATIPLLLSLDMPVRLWHCLVLFVLRTLIAIPVIALVTHLLF
jgi:nucleoside recognition membrane protein YjiH